MGRHSQRLCRPKNYLRRKTSTNNRKGPELGLSIFSSQAAYRTKMMRVVRQQTTAFKEKGFFSSFPTVYLIHFCESQNRPAHYTHHFTNHCCLHCASLSPKAHQRIRTPRSHHCPHFKYDGVQVCLHDRGCTFFHMFSR